MKFFIIKLTGDDKWVTAHSSFLKENIKNENGKYECTDGDGTYADRINGCKGFYICQFQGTSYAKVTYFPCSPGTVYNPATRVCSWNKNVEC